MKRISLIAAAALLFAGAQLHAQGTKADSGKKSSKPAAAKTAAAKSATTAAMPATKTADKPKRKSGGKKPSTKKDTTGAKKP
ncbi:MAG: hypothetical protein ABJF01_21465 [bacterium]